MLTMNGIVFRDMTPCSLVVYRLFGGTYCVVVKALCFKPESRGFETV
jgi:hypothetical protein